MNTSTSLPEAVAQYLAAANRFDAAGAARCFTPDAVVHDEHHVHVGLAAIERWIAQTSQEAQPQVTVLRTQTTDATTKMVGRVTGRFPGSPLDLEFDFRLQDEKIAQLTIQ